MLGKIEMGMDKLWDIAIVDQLWTPLRKTGCPALPLANAQNRRAVAGKTDTETQDQGWMNCAFANIIHFLAHSAYTTFSRQRVPF